MNKIIRWQPVSDLSSLHDAMDRLFEDSWVTPRTGAFPAAWLEPSVDVFETPEQVVIQAAVPGLKPEDVDITVKGNYLAISGESRQSNEGKDRN